MSVQTVYRSPAPEVVEVHDRWEKGAEQFLTFVDSLEKEYEREVLFTRSGASGQIVVGFKALDSDKENPPKGLRFDRTRRYLVPHKSTTLGKKLVRLFSKNANPRPDYPGMAWMALDMTTYAVFYPGSQKIGDYVYITWGCKASVIDQADPDIWDQVSLGDWYTLMGE